MRVSSVAGFVGCVAPLLILGVCGAMPLTVGDLESPDVGDWVSLRLSAKDSPVIALKETLISKDKTTGLIRYEQTVGDTALPAKEHKVRLDQLRDPSKLAATLNKAKVEKLKSGKEEVPVKGKKLACAWTEFKVSFDAGGKTIESASKIWLSSEVPLNGLVKMENDIGGNKTVMELLDYGRAK